MFLKRIFHKTPSPERRAYEAIVAAARQARPYADWGVPDTAEGRFDMITLHTFLVLDRLKGQVPQFRQALVDEVFKDMDRSLREMGVGDLSVGKKVRRMAEAFYGRIAAYDAAILQSPEALSQAIARNIFAGERASDGAPRLADYALRVRERLAGLDEPAIAGGRFVFPEP